MTKEELELSLNENQFEKNIEKLNILIDKVKEKDFYLCKVKAYNDQSKQTVDNDKNRVKNLLSVNLQIPKLINGKLHIQKTETYLFLNNKILDLFNKDYAEYEDLIYSIRIDLMEELKLFKAKKTHLILEKNNPIKQVEKTILINEDSQVENKKPLEAVLKDKPIATELRKPERGELLEKCGIIGSELQLTKFVSLKPGEAEKVQKILIERYKIDTKLDSVKSTLRKLDYCKTQK